MKYVFAIAIVLIFLIVANYVLLDMLKERKRIAEKLKYLNNKIEIDKQSERNRAYNNNYKHNHKHRF